MISSVISDLSTILTNAGFKNDKLTAQAPPPQVPVFRVGVGSLKPIRTDFSNGDKRVVEAEVIITYLYPKSGGDPQASLTAIAVDTEKILDAISDSASLTSGAEVQFQDAVIGTWGPHLRADITFTTQYEIT